MISYPLERTWATQEVTLYPIWCYHLVATTKVGGTHRIGMHSCYRPRSEASEGYVFTGVCHSFCSTGGGGVGGWHQRSQHLPLPLGTRSQHLPPPGTRSQHLPPPGTRSQHFPPPGTRSQHLSPPRDQVTTPPSPPLEPDHNTSLPPPPPGLDHNTSLSPSGTRSQHLPPPGLCGGGRCASHWNAFLFLLCKYIFTKSVLCNL